MLEDENKLEELNFEKALERLEKIVATMEDEGTSLEALIQQFEEGTKLANYCDKKLNEAELVIQQLNEKGEKTPFED